MQSGHAFHPDPALVASAQRDVALSVAALAGLLMGIERQGESLIAATRVLKRPEAVQAADDAVGFLSLAADALRDGATRLAALDDSHLVEELADIVAEVRACSS